MSTWPGCPAGRQLPCFRACPLAFLALPDRWRSSGDNISQPMRQPLMAHHTGAMSATSDAPSELRGSGTHHGPSRAERVHRIGSTRPRTAPSSAMPSAASTRAVTAGRPRRPGHERQRQHEHQQVNREHQPAHGGPSQRPQRAPDEPEHPPGRHWGTPPPPEMGPGRRDLPSPWCACRGKRAPGARAAPTWTISGPSRRSRRASSRKWRRPDAAACRHVSGSWWPGRLSACRAGRRATR